MKLKRRRSSEVPPKIKTFISSVIATPLENIEEPLTGFVWEFDKGDFHHWVDLFNHFDSFFEKHIKSRKDLQVEKNPLESDPPFPREAVLQILRVVRIILENCSNKHFCSSYEQHLSSLLASTDADVIEACLQTLAAFLKKTIGKYSIRDNSLNAKLFALAQGWGGKEEGLGLIACTLQNGCDGVAYDIGCTLHFEFYESNESSSEFQREQPTQGLHIIHLPNVNSHSDSDLELLCKLSVEYKVPPTLRFSLLTRLRYARAFGSLASRQQYVCIRLYAFIVLVQASTNADDLVSFFNSEPEFINELISLLNHEDDVPEKIRILCLLSLVSLSHDRSRQPTVLAAVTSGGHRGILSSLMQKAIDSVINGTSKWSVSFAEALLSLVTVLVSSSSGCTAMREAGFIPTLLPLLKDTDPQHLHLVCSSVHILEAFMDYSNPATTLFRELGGLDDTISRLKLEVYYVEHSPKQQVEDSDCSGRSMQSFAESSSYLYNVHSLYSEALVSYHRRLLMKALLRAISLGTYAPGNTSRTYGSEESLLPQCLCAVFKRAKDFGGGVFSLAANVMSDLIHKDPTCYPVLDAAGLPSAFLDAIMDDVLCSAEAIMCIPQCLDALCLNNNGLQAVKDHNALRCFVKIFTSKSHLRSLAGETPCLLSSGLDELMRHASSLRAPGVDMLIEILNGIAKLGSGFEASSSSSDTPSSSTAVPMETDAKGGGVYPYDDRESTKMDGLEQTNEQPVDTSLTNIESLFPEYVTNAARLLETILQNTDTCRIFVEKKGIDAVLQLFTLPFMPLSTPIGQCAAAAFKNFSSQHSASLARAVCSSLRGHLKSTNELLVSLGGTQITAMEPAKHKKLLTCLSSLEGLLTLCNFLLKGTIAFVTELSNADGDVLKDLGMAYREVIWQLSLCNDSKVVDGSLCAEQANESSEASSAATVGRESDDDANIPVVRYMNPASTRNGSQSIWGGEREFLSVLTSGEGLQRRSLARIRGGRTGRHLDALSIDSEIASNIPETHSHDAKEKSPDEILNKLASTLRSFFTALVKGFTSPNRRRADVGSLSSVSKCLGTALAKIFLEALSFSGYFASGLDMPLSVKCRYLGKVVDDMAALTSDSRRRTCYATMINNFYVHGTFRELLTTFEATSQLLWNLPHPFPTSSGDHAKAGVANKLSHSSWLLDTLQSYCRSLEYFVNSSLLLSTSSASQAQLLVQPVAVGLSIGLFPVPRDPEVFVRMLQSQVLDVILPVWNHPMFPNCNPGFIASIILIITHVYSGAGDVKRTHSGAAGSTNQRFVPPAPDENTIATIVEMGFTRARAEEALGRVETNSVEMAMEWLFSHAEDPVQDDDELARALALSLGNSSEGSKVDNVDKLSDVLSEEGKLKVPPVDDILAASLKLFQSSDTMAFSLTDLLMTLCNQNKGEDRPIVASYLIQQLKLCPLDFSKDPTALSMISHILALLLYEDGTVREIAAQKGIVPTAIDILMNFKAANTSGSDILVPKCISALLLTLDNMLQFRPRILSERVEGTLLGSLPDSSVVEENLASDAPGKQPVTAFEKILGKSTGYMTTEEGHQVLLVACDLMKQHVPAVIMQAVLQLCAQLTKTHALSLQFLENGGLSALFSLPRSCFFPGYDTVASSIIRHLLEDPQTLQSAMELEIRQTLTANRHNARISPRTFLTSMASVISRDPVIFMKAVTAVCQLESSGGRTFVMLSKEKEKEKEKDKPKTSGVEEPVRISDNKMQDGAGKYAKSHKRIPANLSQVIDQLLDIVLKYPPQISQEGSADDLTSMEVDEPATKVKGKSKADETRKKEPDSERSAGLAKVTFVLKLLSDILLMYAHAVGVILKRDLEMIQFRGSNQVESPGYGGILYHVLHRLLPISTNKCAGPDEWRNKLSEKTSWFLVVLCGRSGEGRRRVVNELVKGMLAFSDLESNLNRSTLLPDADVIEACLQTLAAFLKKTIGKYSIRDNSLNAKLFALAQGWGGKEEGLGLIACTLQNGCDGVAYDIGCTLHFEFYESNESSSEFQREQPTQGLHIIHLPNVNSHSDSDLELLCKLSVEYKVPPTLRFSLLTRLRYARAFGSLASRQQYVCIRLYAFIVLVQASTNADDLVSFFNSEPEFINELISLLNHEDDVPEKIRILCLLSLVSLSHDRSRQPTVLAAVTSGGHRGILSSLMQKAIDSVINGTSKWSVSFAEALLSLVTVLVSSSSGCTAMREAGFIPTLLPLLKDTDPQHLHLVCSSVHILEAFMDYSNPATTLFRELGGLDDTISRLKLEVYYVEHSPKQQVEDSDCSGRSMQSFAESSSYLYNVHSLYSEALVSYHRRLLMKALLRAISLGTYAPGNTSRTYGSEESLLPQCLCAVFKRAKDFGGGVFSLAANVMSDLIHKDPTCYPVLDAAGLPSAFLDAIMDDVLCSAEAIMCIPQCLDALCLNNNGLQAVKDHNALRCFVKIFTSKSHLRSLAGETPCLLSSGLDELMRHASSLRAPGVDMLIEILNGIAKLGSGFEASSSSSDTPSSSTAVPMETDAKGGGVYPYDDRESTKMDGLEQTNEQPVDTSLTNIESLFPEYVTNAARLLETILQNTDTCRIFVEKKGIDAVLQLFTLPFMPLSTPIGQCAAAAFKNFSSQHSASLARAVCSSLRGHLKSTNELLVSLGGTQITAMEPAKHKKLLTCLSSLEGLLTLCNFLLKGTIAFVTELSNADGDVLKDLGMAYREVIWQLSLCNDSKVVDGSLCAEQANESSEASSAATVGRESDDDANIPVVRYMNPASTRNGSQSIWGGEREFLSVLTSGEGLQRRSLARIRGGRTGRHLDALSIDSEIASNIPETHSHDAKEKSPDEILNKLASTLRSFFTALVKGFTSPNRRRADVGSLSSVSKCLGTALAKIFLEALSFSGYFASGLDMPLSVKCRYLGKVVDDMAALTSDSRRRTCYATMINNFYVHGTFRELLTTFEATSQLLWNLPHPFPTSSGDHAKAGVANKLSHSSWLLDTLQSYCRSLEYFVNSSLLLSTSSASQTQLLVQPVAVGLSIGLFPVPRDPEVFVRMLQSQVLDVILPVWNHPMFPNCNPGFIASIILIITHVYSGAGDVKRTHSGAAGSTNQRFVPPAPDENTIATIVEMGFTRARAEEALGRVETNSVEMAMEWLFSHAEDPVQDDDELARALALSLGNSSEGSKVDNVDKLSDVLSEEGKLKVPPVDDILAASLKLFQSSDTMAFSLTDLLMTLCNQNKGGDRPIVASYLIQQLKLCPLDFSKDPTALSMISHILALLLYEDGTVREIAAQKGIVPTAIDILMNFKAANTSGSDILVPKCISALLLTLDNMLQFRPRILSERVEGTLLGSLPDSSVVEENLASDAPGKQPVTAFEKILGKSTGYMTTEEGHQVLLVACDLMKQHVPAVIMQAVLQLCARLTKTHALSLQFLENGGLSALFSLPRSCFFPGYDTVASSIIRHLLEDPQTLQSAMELEIRQTLTANRHNARISPRTFLTSMASVISRDPVIFMKAVTAVCQLESSGGRTFVMLSKEKEKEKEKDKPKTSGVEEPVRISDNKMQDGAGKYAKSHKRIPANLSQVIDQLLDIVLKYPPQISQEGSADDLTSMEVDEPATKVKGKSKADETRKKEPDSERSAGLAKVTFVLKLLSDILLMYAHAVGVILKRDLEMIQFRGSNQVESPGYGGILYHVLHRLLPISTNKCAGPDEWRNKLSEKTSWFLVVLCGRSGEGRRRVVNELVKGMLAFSDLESNLNRSTLLPDKKVFAFADLVYSILSKSASSSNLPGSGCSPDIAKSMIEGGMVQCLSGILQVIDLDHPDAPKIVNLILKALESLTRAANASDVLKSDPLNKKSLPSDNRPDQTAASIADTIERNHNNSGTQEVLDAVETELQQQGSTQVGNNLDVHPNQSAEQDMRIEPEEAMAEIPSMEIGMDFMREEMDEGGVLHNSDQIEMNFRVDNRADDDMVDEDDDMGDDEDNEEGEDEDEDEDIAEDGAGMMSLADTDVEDHDDTGLGDDYNDEMIDEEDDDFHENRVIEVRWREALDGLDHLQVLGQPGAASGLLDVSAEPFEGVNVDDLFGLHRPVGFERRQQIGRSSFERSITEVNGFQHPLLLRPSQSGDLASMWSSGGHASRDLESLSGGNFDIPHFYMFDAPVLPFDNANSLFGDRLGSAAPPPLSDFSISMDPLQIQGRRPQGDSRWTDDGQPQAAAQAAAIAQAVEEHFVSQLHCVSPANGPGERQSQSSRVQENQPSNNPPSNEGELVLEGDNTSSQQAEVQQEENSTEDAQREHISAVESLPCSEQVNGPTLAGISGECLQSHEPMLVQPISLSSTPNGHDNMEIGEGNGFDSDQVGTMVERPSTEYHAALECDGDPEVPVNHHDPSLQVAGCDSSLRINVETSDCVLVECGSEMPSLDHANVDVDMNGTNTDANHSEGSMPAIEHGLPEPSSRQEALVLEDASQGDQTSVNTEVPGASAIDPTFLEALPEELRAEVLASQQAQAVQTPTYAPPSVDDIDPEFLAALPSDIQAEVLAQQRAQRIAQQADGQPVDMDNASIIATFPADLREEVLLTSSEAVLSALPSPLLAEAQMLRDRAMSHYQARSLFGSNHRLTNRRNGLGLDRQTVMDRGVGVTVGRRTASAFSESMKVKELEGEPLLDENALKALIRLLRLAQPLGKGLLQKLLLNLCAHSLTRATLVRLMLNIVKPEAEGSASGLATINSLRLYGCQSNVVYGRSQMVDGLPPMVLRRILEILTYLATNHSSIAKMLFYWEPSAVPSPHFKCTGSRMDKGKEKVDDGIESSKPLEDVNDIPLILFLKLLNRPLFLRSTAHLEQILGLLQVVVYAAASKLECRPQSKPGTENPQEQNGSEALQEPESRKEDKRTVDSSTIFLQLPQHNLRSMCNLLGREGLSDKVYTLAGEVLKKLASVAAPHRNFFRSELSELAHGLSSSAVSELITLRTTHMLGLSAGSMAGAAILRVLEALSSLTCPGVDENVECDREHDEQATMWKLNIALEPLWRELSECISVTETQLGQSSINPPISNINAADHAQGASSSPPLPPGTQRLLPFIEAFFVLCEKLQANLSAMQQEHANVTAREVKESAGSSTSLTTVCSGESQRKLDGAVTFARFADKHRRLLNTFVRQNPGMLEKSLSMMLKAPRLIDFDNKRAYFRSRIRQQHEQHLSGPLRISVRRAYVLEDSYNQLRMRPTQDLKGRLNVQFQGEEGIDAGGLTREWYQLLSRVIFDKGALLYTTVGNNATFQPNPNSVYQTEHLSYFKFVGRVALFDGQLLDVYFTRSFYKHILGVKVTYHDIEAVDPDYYKNLKWMLENDVSDIPDLTFSMDADEEKHILYEKTEVTDYELKPGGRNTRVTEESKHEYVDLVADHILTNAIRPQINSFLEGFNELVPRDLISIFNDKELELLISGLPEIDLDDLKANTEYTGYTAASGVVQWFWELVKSFNKEDMARLLQFVTGTSKVPLEGFKALQGISGPQRFQIHKAYGAPERLPSAHTCFNQLDLPEYSSKEQLQERLLLAIHEASEGFGFG